MIIMKAVTGIAYSCMETLVTKDGKEKKKKTGIIVGTIDEHIRAVFDSKTFIME